MSAPEFVPYHQLGGRPNIVVDGEGTDGTVLTLSHWPGSGSPPGLAADLSTQIAFNYLDAPSAHVDADAVSNNHYDQDGLCGVYAVLRPDQADERRDRLIDIASAGDFETFINRDAARVSIALAAYGDEATSPIAGDLAGRSYPDQVGIVMEYLLPRLAEIADDPRLTKPLWEEEDARLSRDDEAISAGRVTIDERPEIDLAIVTTPPGYGNGAADQWSGGCSPMSIHNRTRRHRILVIQGRQYVLRYRYETWVDFVSRPVMPRLDLKPLAAALTAEDSDGAWAFDGVGALTPSLHRDGESSLPPERFIEAVESYLHGAE